MAGTPVLRDELNEVIERKLPANGFPSPVRYRILDDRQQPMVSFGLVSKWSIAMDELHRATLVASLRHHTDVDIAVVSARLRPNSTLAIAYDLKVFFTVVPLDPLEVWLERLHSELAVMAWTNYREGCAATSTRARATAGSRN